MEDINGVGHYECKPYEPPKKDYTLPQYEIVALFDKLLLIDAVEFEVRYGGVENASALLLICLEKGIDIYCFRISPDRIRITRNKEQWVQD